MYLIYGPSNMLPNNNNNNTEISALLSLALFSLLTYSFCDDSLVCFVKLHEKVRIFCPLPWHHRDDDEHGIIIVIGWRCTNVRIKSYAFHKFPHLALSRWSTQVHACERE
jgi:hypothetical protein